VTENVYTIMNVQNVSIHPSCTQRTTLQWGRLSLY